MSDSPRLGTKIRALRRRETLSQVQLAQRLGISASYLNLIEHNRRPLSAQLLIRLAQLFQLDLQTFAEDDQDQLVSDLYEAFGDPLFEGHDLTSTEVKELVGQSPPLARAVITLYQAYRTTRDSAESLAGNLGASPGTTDVDRSNLPSEEVSDLIQRHQNYFPEIESAAEMLWRIGRLESQDLFRGLAAYLDSVHGIRVRIERDAQMGGAVRRFLKKEHVLELSEILAPRTRNFQLAHQIGLIDHAELFGRMAKDQTLSSEDARAVCRVALANYFAGAVLMPYAPFHEAAQETRYDVELLGHRFRVSWEQVCHRLTTLQRPGAEGVPFHLVRLDIAGNISKRFSVSGFRFARFSGACPRWNEHAAFLTPGMVRTQLSQMPDGTTYFSVARTVRDDSGGYTAPHALHAVGLGCEVRYAKDLVYAQGIDLGGLTGAVPIGVACRVCERLDCEQRAFPPLLQPLKVDENFRGRSFYVAVQAKPGALD